MPQPQMRTCNMQRILRSEEDEDRTFSLIVVRFTRREIRGRDEIPMSGAEPKRR